MICSEQCDGDELVLRQLVPNLGWCDLSLQGLLMADLYILHTNTVLIVSRLTELIGNPRHSANHRHMHSARIQ